MKQIITHPGSAHKDDFLACSVLASEHNLPIVRRDPTEEDLADAEIYVVDVGEVHDPALRNFDHHQFDRDHPPTCSLSMVLQDLGLYEDALKFCPWMETAEWLDARGVRGTAEWLEVDPFVVTQLSSPIDFSILRYFAQEEELPVDHPIWNLMERIGGDLVSYLRTLRKDLNRLAERVEIWKVNDLSFCFLSREEEEEAAELAGSVGMFVRELEEDIVGTILPDSRGEGYGLKRFDDDLRLNFTRIREEPDVHFAHKQGFVAKTSATHVERLQELLRRSVV